jgi:Tfp pilus assembly PilM family ATPase
MWNMLTKSRPWPIGVDLACDGVRMLQLCRTATGLSVWAGGQWKSSQVASGRAAIEARMADALREIVRSGNFAGRRAVVAIPAEEIEIRNIRVGDVGPEELVCTVMAQAHEAFDFDLSLSRLMAVNAGFTVQGDEAMQEIILLAIPDYAIRRRRDWLEEHGLIVDYVDAEPFALLRSFARFLRRQRDRHRFQTIIGVGYNATQVLVSHGRRVLFIKTIPTGESTLTQAAARHLTLSREDAHLLRRQIMREHAGRQPDHQMFNAASGGRFTPEERLFWTVHDAVRDEMEKLVLEIGLCLRYCSTTFGCPRIDKVTLCGAGAWDPSLMYLLQERYGLASESAWPMRGIDTGNCPVFGERRGVMSDWAACVGLACWGKSRSGMGNIESLQSARITQQEGETS